MRCQASEVCCANYACCLQYIWACAFLLYFVLRSNPFCVLVALYLQRTQRLFKNVIIAQTGITGLFSHLKDIQIEAIYANDAADYDNSNVVYIVPFVGLVLAPGDDEVPVR